MKLRKFVKLLFNNEIVLLELESSDSIARYESWKEIPMQFMDHKIIGVYADCVGVDEQIEAIRIRLSEKGE